MIRYHLVWWLAFLAATDFSAIERRISAADFRGALTQLESQAERPAAWFVLASKAHDGLNDPAQAVAAAENALRLDPRSEAAHLQLGYIFLSRNTPAAAAEIFEEAERILPHSVPLRLGRGLALKELQRYDEAEAALSGCWPHPIAFDALSTVYVHRSKFAVARALAVQFIAVNPGDYRGHYYLAAALDGLEEKGAPDALRQSLARNPGFAAAHALLGKIRLREGDLAAAIQSLREAIRLRADLTQAHLQLAQALQRAGRDAEAAREFDIVRGLKIKEAEPRPSLLFHRGER
jgi:tetratricopeptide (TPR) repeat protein